MNIEILLCILNECYGRDTCYPKLRSNWSENNKQLGQCAITSLIVDDYFNYDIYKCKVNGVSHYFNMNNSKIIDLTKEQFGDSNIQYENLQKVSRDEILSSDDTRKRYFVLKNRVLEKINSI